MVGNRDDAALPHLERSSASHAAYAPPEELCAALRDRYEIQREIGRGASAVVYLAQDKSRNVLVAIKVLHDEVSPAASSARFRREVEIERRLQHDHIVPVVDSGFAGGRAYYTMPYFDGQTLREKLQRERQLSIDETLSIATQIAAALDYAHGRGVVHRDVKPANILMTADGVRVADFGIARAMVIASGDSVTDSGFTVGTPEYMSPEQAAGNRDIDGRSDIYALGCVVYQMLAGEPPFTGPTAQAIIARHFQEAPRSVRVVRPSVPLPMQQAIERALAKVPADRFQTAAEFVAGLSAPAVVTPTSSDALLDASRVVTPQPMPVLEERPKRFRLRTVLIGAVALIGLTGATYAVGNNMLVNAGTNSFRARRAFIDGTKWIAAGNFARADTAFSKAKSADPEYRQALIWSALVRWWLDAQSPSPSALATATVPKSQRGKLSANDTILLSGLVALSESKLDSACRLWSTGNTVVQKSASLLYSAGTCLRRDGVVMADSASPSRWRFRTSYEEALIAYEKAFDLQPSLLGGFGSASLTELQDLYRTNSSRTREGRTPIGAVSDFRAYPDWDLDSLAYVPYPRAILLAGGAPKNFAVAIQRQRQRLLRVSRAWIVAAPRDPIAARLYAVALDLLGDAGAPQAFREARSLAENASDNLSIAAEEMLVRVKHSIPDDTASLRRAIISIDSLLLAHPPSERKESRMLGALAALLGKAGLAAAYAVNGGVEGAAHALTGSGPAVLTYASLGGPPDSVHKYEALAEAAVASLPEVEGDRSRRQWIWRSASLAYPDYVMQSLNSGAEAQNSIIEPTVAAIAGDSIAVHIILAKLESTRKYRRPTDVMIEGPYVEANAFLKTRNPAAAIGRLDPWLLAIRFATTSELGQIPRTGALVRTIALRANLADAAGERVAARRWANVVVLLWANADAFLKQKVEEMKYLAR